LVVLIIISLILTLTFVSLWSKAVLLELIALGSRVLTTWVEQAPLAVEIVKGIRPVALL